jgi:hypothetical protein
MRDSTVNSEWGVQIVACFGAILNNLLNAIYLLATHTLVKKAEMRFCFTCLSLSMLILPNYHQHRVPYCLVPESSPSSLSVLAKSLWAFLVIRLPFFIRYIIHYTWYYYSWGVVAEWSKVLAQCRLLSTRRFVCAGSIPGRSNPICSLSPNSFGHSHLLRSAQPPTIRWMENEYQLRLRSVVPGEYHTCGWQVTLCDPITYMICRPGC